MKSYHRASSTPRCDARAWPSGGDLWYTCDMERLKIHLEHPQRRHVVRVIECMRAGGVVICPTDTTYGLCCDLFLPRSIDRIRRLKGLEADHPLSFLCPDLSDIARYGIVEDRNFRILRRHTPGRYTFVLPATREVPRLVQNRKTRTVGIRIPESAVCRAMLEELGHPIITTTVALPRQQQGKQAASQQAYLNDPDVIEQAFGRSVDMFLDGGPIHGEPSSVIDLTGEAPVILRAGSGDTSWIDT